MNTKQRPKKKTIEIVRGGKDEMNLAEHPLHFMTNKTTEQEIKTLIFHDSHGKLIITGSDLLGLPTPIDMDVLIALIELAKKRNDFKETMVNFTRYELIRMMGWSNTSSSYDRLEESLNRWSGILLIYDGNYWDNRLKKYTKQNMGIIENVSIVEGKAVSSKGRQETLPLSSFEWNSRFFQSCQNNNLKNLDTAYYFSLRFPTSKQLFRFLDKRFYRQAEWVFSLREIGFERAGLSRNYNDSKLKEKLADAIGELETTGFLKPLNRDERYFKTSEGWKMRFVDGRNGTTKLTADEPVVAEEPNGLVAELMKRGIIGKVSCELVQNYPPEYIQGKIEAFDFEMTKPKPPRKPAGFLVKSIQDGYTPDPKFVSSADRERQTAAKRQAEQQAAEDRRRKQAEESAERAIAAQVATYRKTATPEQLARLEADAIAQASEDMRQSLDNPAMKPFRKTLLLSLVRDHIAQLIQSGQLAVEPA
jgi:Replication initiator protein A